MNSTMKKAVATCAMVLTVLGSLAFPVSAAGITYTAINGGTSPVNKYLVMDAQAQVPNAEFTFAIAPGSGSSLASDGTTLVLPGPSGATITSSLSFNPADNGSKLTAVASGDTVQLDAGEAYVKKTVTADFSNVSFNEPAIYRWLVTEAGTNQGIANDTQKGANATAMQRTLDVYVIDNNGSLEIAGYVLHEGTDIVALTSDMGSGDVASAGAALADKSDGFVNEYDTSDLEFGKEVEGNQGSKDKYFEFTLEISGATHGAKYTVDLSNADASPVASAATTKTVAANPAELTADENGEISQKFYLKDDQYIKVLGLAAGTNYEVSEDEEDYLKANGTEKVAIAGSEAVEEVLYSQEDFDAYVAENGEEPDWQVGDVKVSGQAAVADKLHDDNVSGTIANDVYTGFTNTRDGFVPTGVLVSAVPAMAILGVAGFTAFNAMKKKEEDEE